MKALTLLAFISFPVGMYGQDFATQLCFEDARGNKDTITIGYDYNATDSIDKNLGEIDLNGVAMDSVLDVRITDDYRYEYYGAPFLTKKQLFKNICGKANTPGIGTLLVKCKYYPLTISWTQSAFNDSCRSHSFITDWHPGGWFDAVSGGEQGPFYFKNQQQVVLTHILHPFTYKYNNELTDTVRLLFYSIASSLNYGMLTHLETPAAQKLWIYPNPATNNVYLSNEAEAIERVSVADIYGRQLSCPFTTNAIDLSALPKGVYLLNVQLKNHAAPILQKVIKQ